MITGVDGLPLFLGTVRGYNSLQIGQIMSVGGIAMFIGGPLAGALIRKVDPRIVMAFGLSLAAIGLYGLRQAGVLTADAVFTPTTFLWAILAGGALIGAGFALGGYCPGTCVVGVSSLAAGHLTLVPALRAELDRQGRSDIAIVVGGVIPEQDFAELRQAGAAAIYPPGTNIPVAATDLLKGMVKAAREGNA